MNVNFAEYITFNYDGKEAEISEEDKQLLNIVYGRNQTKVEKQEMKNEMFEKKEDSLLNNILSELDKSHNRHFLAGVLISFMISFIIWSLYNSIFGKKKQTTAAPSVNVYHRRKRD